MTSDPYKVLGLGHDADSDLIRSRYLQLVREHPPEREPQRFGEIRAAYEQLRDPIESMTRRLFSTTSSVTFEELRATQRRDIRQQRLPTDLLLSLGRS
ncbi:MAG: J domain-containing protein [Pirellulaceae bacterium]